MHPILQLVKRRWGRYELFYYGKKKDPQPLKDVLLQYTLRMGWKEKEETYAYEGMGHNEFSAIQDAIEMAATIEKLEWKPCPRCKAKCTIGHNVCNTCSGLGKVFKDEYGWEVEVLEEINHNDEVE